ncbi:MAG: DUF115 domain-containing protein, partial [Candidatus Adiutrix sp.]|nr:DUF115 domain-containing protein [Candidatus Adiutrix sp.]
LIPSRPAFIVGSGPSLDQSAPLLKNIGDRGVILAAASSLKPLLAYGVSPDVVLTLESSDTSGYLELSPEERLVLGQETVLALASSVHPAHFKVRGFHQAVFHLTAGEAQTFGCGLFLPQGGNAGSAAFALAYCWGLDPLILVAQDQAYANGRLHAGGTPGTAQDGSRGDIAIRGLGDSRVTTDSGLLASLNWFAEAAKTIRRRPSPPALFNAAAAGAVIPGFSQTDLGALTASLAPAPSKLNLARALAKSPPASKEEIQDDLAQMAGLINTLRRLARMDHKKAFAEIREIGAISKFLAQILAGAAAADSRGELLGALDKADGLMSLMLSSFQ